MYYLTAKFGSDMSSGFCVIVLTYTHIHAQPYRADKRPTHWRLVSMIRLVEHFPINITIFSQFRPTLVYPYAFNVHLGLSLLM